MAPLLIDSRDVLKLIFISVLVTLLVFVGGFIVGLKRADAFYQAGGSVVQSLALPEYVEVANIADSHLPASIVAGENIDVDQPGSVVETAVEKLAAVSESEDIPALHDGVSKALSRPGIAVQQATVEQPDTETDTGYTATFTSDELSKIKYSIQVGMYGRLRNAENMMKTLQTQKYEAYISGYTNNKNETRYNVRFGYFPDRKSAVSTLEKFKSDEQSDGYLVRFSVDDIVTIARAAGDSHNMTAPENNESLEIDMMPAISNPAGMSSDKISQADVLNDGRTKAN